MVESTVSEYFDGFKRSIQMGQPLSSEEAAKYNTLDKRVRLLPNSSYLRVGNNWDECVASIGQHLWYPWPAMHNVKYLKRV